MPYPGARKRIRITTKVLNEGTGAYDLTDPTTVEVTVEDPAGVETTYAWDGAGGAADTITKSATGRFYVDVTCPTAGEWAVRAEAAGAMVGAGEQTWTILPSHVEE